jgi:hypothetical protein
LWLFQTVDGQSTLKAIRVLGREHAYAAAARVAQQGMQPGKVSAFELKVIQGSFYHYTQLALAEKQRKAGATHQGEHHPAP